MLEWQDTSSAIDHQQINQDQQKDGGIEDYPEEQQDRSFKHNQLNTNSIGMVAVVWFSSWLSGQEAGSWFLAQPQNQQQRSYSREYTRTHAASSGVVMLAATIPNNLCRGFVN
ncbi:MAG TPA: hypothetical protein VKY85_03985 [Candidatus Angelobacter sp.]|nr:hypothetical protein [Candidatus Angelobacter sp.]